MFENPKDAELWAKQMEEDFPDLGPLDYVLGGAVLLVLGVCWPFAWVYNKLTESR